MTILLACLALTYTLQDAVVPPLKLADQFSQPRDLAQHRGEIIVLVYGDRASQSANQALGEKLHVTFHPTAQGQPPAAAQKAPVLPLASGQAPEVRVVPVACASGVPNLVQNLIRSQIRKNSPDVPVWLDFEERLSKLFGLTAGVPNVAVIDARGRYRHKLSGVPTREQLAELTTLIETLRLDAAAGR